MQNDKPDTKRAAVVKTWDIPYLGEQDKYAADGTNALNRRSDWVYEPPEPEPEIEPPTAEEIEAIRQAAREEGLEEGMKQGLEQGLQQGLEQGLEQGHAEGLEKGYAEGVAKAEEDISQQIAKWQELMNHLHKPVSRVEKELERELVLLATSLAKAVIKVEPSLSENMLLQALTEGLKALPINEQRYQIQLHPDDLALIKAHYGNEYIEQHGWQLMESPQMQPGGCDISTQNNAVDVSVERRVRDVIDKFLLEQGLNQHTR